VRELQRRQPIMKFEATGVTYTDDDGTTYRRIIKDGEIVEHEV